jgi:hypothetical protein
MKQPRRPGATRRSKYPGRTPPERKEKAGSEEHAVQEGNAIDTDHLLEEVQEANEHIPDPAERERVIPSRPC